MNRKYYIIYALIVVICALTSENSRAHAKKSATKKASSKNESRKNPLSDVQEKYKNVKTLTAEFTQRQKNVTLGTTKESSGRIYIMRPNKFRWETHEPEKSLLVGNGKKVWFYTAPFREGEKGQVMTKRAADVQSKLAIDLLSGQSDSNKDFKIKKLAEGHFSLVPLKPAGDIEHIELFVEKATNLVYKLVLFTKSGNETELTLKNVTLNPKLSVAMFNFVPPPNTEEIR